MVRTLDEISGFLGFGALSPFVYRALGGGFRVLVSGVLGLRGLGFQRFWL